MPMIERLEPDEALIQHIAALRNRCALIAAKAKRKAYHLPIDQEAVEAEIDELMANLDLLASWLRDVETEEGDSRG